MTAFDRSFIASTVAGMLWEVDAVAFRPDPPFVFTSGWASPVYIDVRKLISYPRLRRTLLDFAEKTVLHAIGHEQIDAVAGGETAGIPYAAWLAERLMLPMQYVRKQPKGFGRNARIEGAVKEGWRTLLVEDLATDGRSKVGFVGALRDAGQSCEHAFVVFYYDVFPHARATIEKLGIRLHHLCTWRDVLAVARSEQRFPTAVLGEVEAFLADPVGWSARHGGLDHVPD
ncbi:MAG: orotate phosphoribosyltransferase [Geminicoccaceae bacterium]|nr:orotate phosphoribosyltransferase [Geminicoccaceae bacterium]